MGWVEQEPDRLHQELTRAAPRLFPAVEDMVRQWLSPALLRLKEGPLTGAVKTVNDPVWGAIELYPWEILQQLAASETRTRTKEAQLDKIAGLLSAIDTPAEHETALRAILRVVMDEN
jgi:hypothetical protein